MSYEAIVARVTNVRAHPNADRIKLATVAGSQVIIGLDTPEGELGVFFPSDGQLSHEFCVANNLYNKQACFELELNPPSFGFFDTNRRVRNQAFRGQKSYGFWVPLSYFDYIWGIDAPMFSEEGYTFTAIGNQEICNKYETRATRQAGIAKLGRKQRENRCFPKHDVTKKFGYVSRDIPLSGSIFYITEKLHGTSGRYGRVLEDLPNPWWRRIFGLQPKREYQYLNGSKNVILERTSGPGWYGTNDFRTKATKGLELHKGEILYFELVGYVHDDVKIMPAHPIKDEVKSLRAQYGDTMQYVYGCPPGTTRLFVYKIAHINEDGIGHELSYPEMARRCGELGLQSVPLLRGPFMAAEDGLERAVEELTDGPSSLDPSHIREGVVLRVESHRGIEHIKNKSWHFGVLEGYIKDSEDYVDEEESS